jgi:anhydro-N-acetylmuramic acid kinase
MESRRIIGLMSGTSLDGLDIALCRFTGYGFETTVEVEAFETVVLPEVLRLRLQTAISGGAVSLDELTLLNAEFGRFSGQAVRQFLEKQVMKPECVQLVVSHGQTIWHAPRRKDWNGAPLNATLQIGDGDHLAANCGIPVLCDLRQKHTATGREGAPLAIYLDVLLYGRRGKIRALLNLGGISNVTLIDFRGDSPHIFTTDCGPANTLLDGWTQRHFGVPFDANGAIAATGFVHHALLAALFEHTFFQEPFPKSTGREVFHLSWLDQVLIRFPGISPEDVLCTLTAFSAECVRRAIVSTKVPPGEMMVSGGGVHNLSLMQQLSDALPGWHVAPLSGIHPDAKEAVLFALLGNEYLANRNGYYPWGPAALGKLCLP